jgi:hypothetical protein
VQLVTTKAFPTVEARLEIESRGKGVELDRLPLNEEVLSMFSSCILNPEDTKKLEIANMSASLASEIKEVAYRAELESERGIIEKDWPLGPVGRLGSIWPFIFASSDGTYEAVSKSPRLFIGGVVGVFGMSNDSTLLNLPEITAGFNVLNDLLQFLPPAGQVPPTGAMVSRFMYLLKTALPFGSPVETSLDILTQLDTAELNQSDMSILSQTTGSRASNRLPSWKPFPLQSASLSSGLKLHVVESIAFEVMDGDVRSCTVKGRVMCDCDLPGAPEIVLPIDVQTVLSLHDCAKLTNTSQTNEDISRISFMPPNGQFTLATFSLYKPTDPAFPMDLSFSLRQVSPTQFQFTCSAKLRVLFSHLSIVFCVSEQVPIANIADLVVSPRCRVDVTNNCFVVWTFKNPSTYSDGEMVSGIIETQRPLHAGEQITESAEVVFRISDDYFSKLKFFKENISFFPNVNKVNIQLSQETVSSGGCFILNSVIDGGRLDSLPMDFGDCINMTSYFQLHAHVTVWKKISINTKGYRYVHVCRCDIFFANHALSLVSLSRFVQSWCHV